MNTSKFHYHELERHAMKLLLIFTILQSTKEQKSYLFDVSLL